MDKPKVLIVEDDVSICVVVSAALAAENIECEICDTVSARDAALEMGSFDLMLTDVLLRDSDGLATISQAIARCPDMPVIVMSAQNTLETAVRASEIDAFEYFPKPFDLNELLIAIKQGIDRRRNAHTSRPAEAMIAANLPLVGRSAAMQDVYRMVARLLRNDLSVLILGESGTGKELVAEAIHNLGHRKTGPFVAVNMAAIPAELIEAELFGHEKGAFTGATGQSIGRFEQAQGGTLFLDEIGDMPKIAQTRLLRALQSGQISRVGGKANIKLDVRILAATHQNLEDLIAAGKFREDLYYRLNVVPINMPPLRDRPEDVVLLAEHFLRMAANEGLPSRQIDDDAMHLLSNLPWRGNVRELKNLIYRLALVSREEIISEGAVLQSVEPQNIAMPSTQGCSFEAAISQFFSVSKGKAFSKEKIYSRALAEFEMPLLQTVMKQAGGNQLKAASMLGINRNTLRKKLNDYRIGHNNAG
jgi:two-component system, NtrC family, nitrogen regulation response regulator GlnG